MNIIFLPFLQKDVCNIKVSAANTMLVNVLRSTRHTRKTVTFLSKV